VQNKVVPSALARLFDHLGDDVARFLSRLAYVDQQDVEDLVHDVFLAVFKKAGSYQRRSGVKTWIFAIAGNVARERQRKRSRGRDAHSHLRRVQDDRDRRSPERGAIAQQLVSRIERGMAALPHDLRLTFVMCDVEGLPGTEVARALGIPTGTLYRRLHEARKRLRDAIDGGGR